MPVAASSTSSDSVLMKCAAVPKAVPAATIQAAGSSGRGAARLTTAGREPNATAYGSHDHAVAFRPRL